VKHRVSSEEQECEKGPTHTKCPRCVAAQRFQSFFSDQTVQDEKRLGKSSGHNRAFEDVPSLAGRLSGEAVGIILPAKGGRRESSHLQRGEDRKPRRNFDIAPGIDAQAIASC
jgi:hypothetical protein